MNQPIKPWLSVKKPFNPLQAPLHNLRLPALERGVTGFARASSVDLSQISFTQSKHFRSGNRPCGCGTGLESNTATHSLKLQKKQWQCQNPSTSTLLLITKQCDSVDLCIVIPAKHDLIPLTHPYLLVKS